ncbi:MAG: cytochrome b N-terminal domain-containing protein, partial [Gemmatimonadales bacterium]
MDPTNRLGGSETGRAEGGPGLSRRFWRSLFRGPLYPRDDRERKWVVVNHLILHFRPVRLPARTLSYTHTFGLGGMSLVLFLLLAATGILLMFIYEPSPDRAYDSMLALENEVFFGKLVRNIHHWSANFIIAVVFLHLLRVYFTSGYHGPRQFNWLIGLALLLCVLVSNFTGYLLPWDQLSYWAITICTGMIGYVPLLGEWLQGVIRGGPEIGSATLINFYTFHTTVIPVLLIVLMAWHFWRVRKAHGVVIPRAPGEERDETPESVLALPNLLMREFAVALILVAFVMSFSTFVNAPLGEAANPGLSPNPAKAPWYFVGFQELLFHFHGLFAVVVIPLLVAAALVLLPYLQYDRQAEGVWFVSRKGRRLGTTAAAIALAVTPLWIALDEYWIDYATWFPGLPPALRAGALPFA